MGIKISALPSIAIPAFTDVFPVVQNGVTYKESMTQLSSLFATAGANSNITSLAGLTTPLSVSQGGTGITSFGTGVAAALGQNVVGSGGMALSSGFSLWTPVFSFATPGDLSVVYTKQKGFYVKTGNVYLIYATVNCTPTFTTASGNFQIGGLPQASNSTTDYGSQGSINISGTFSMPASTNFLTANIGANTTIVNVYANGAGAALLNQGNFTSGAGVQVIFSLNYSI